MFARDESANKVWAIEVEVANGFGEATRFDDLRDDAITSAMSDPADEEPGLRYTSMTDVPANWYPLVPVLRTASDEEGRVLRQAYMLDMDLNPILPAGQILRTHPRSDDRTPYELSEEVVGRIAQRLVRRFELARKPDGSPVLWLTRRRRAAEPQTQSGLRFDAVDVVGQDQ